jgi:two-component system chemotaxis response regulator CheY
MALRFIIVEDNLLTREMIKGLLDILGHQVVGEAEDQASALAAYEQHKPDALTIDLSLPKEDGITILRALRAQYPDARAIIVSGNSQTRIREEALKAGAAELIVKPIDLDNLRECLGKVFPHETIT